MIKKYKAEINSVGIESLKFEHNIEILNPAQSIFGNSKIVPIEDIFEKADTFDGIRFISLDHLKKIKRHLNREKDLEDITLIENYSKAKKQIS